MSCGCYCSNHLYPVRKHTRKRQTKEYGETLPYISSGLPVLLTRQEPSAFDSKKKKKKIHPRVTTMGFPLWKEWVLAPNNDPKRDAVEIFWAMTTSLEHVLRLLRWFLWRWNTLRFGVVVKKKISHIILFSMLLCNLLGKKEKPQIAPNLLSRVEMGKEWKEWRVEMGKEWKGEAFFLPRSCGLRPPRRATISMMTEWLVGKTQLHWPALSKVSKVLGVQGSGKVLSSSWRRFLSLSS